MTEELMLELWHKAGGDIYVYADLVAEKEREACAECGVDGGHALYCVACAEKFVGGCNDTQMTTKCTNQYASDIRGTITPQEAITFLVFLGWSKNKIAKYCKTDHSVISRIASGYTQSCNYILADSLRGLVDKIKTHHNIKATHEEV